MILILTVLQDGLQMHFFVEGSDIFFADRIHFNYAELLQMVIEALLQPAQEEREAEMVQAGVPGL